MVAILQTKSKLSYNFTWTPGQGMEAVELLLQGSHAIQNGGHFITQVQIKR
jgi:hypothetical protein